MPSGRCSGAPIWAAETSFCCLPQQRRNRYRVDETPTNPEPTSARRVIAVKGYQHFAGRALTALQAIDKVRDHLRDYRVCIFSPFPEVRQEAERLRSQRGINVECLAEQVPHDDILRLHGRARVSIAISIGDGISTALLEAMAMGSFPIQTCTACADEWIVDGKSGFIVHPDDLEQIADRLLRAMNDDELVDNAAALNFERISASASLEVVAAQVKAAYAQIPLPNSGPRRSWINPGSDRPDRHYPHVQPRRLSEGND